MRGGPARPGLPESPRASLPPHHYLHPSTLLPTPTTQRTKISKFSDGRAVRAVYWWPPRQVLPGLGRAALQDGSSLLVNVNKIDQKEILVMVVRWW